MSNKATDLPPALSVKNKNAEEESIHSRQASNSNAFVITDLELTHRGRQAIYGWSAAGIKGQEKAIVYEFSCWKDYGQ
jgi:hypothetical protein